MCVVLIGCQQEVPWRWKHAQYLDGPEQLQSWLCENTHRTKRRNHQRSPRMHASMIMLPDGEKEVSTVSVALIGCHQEGPWRWKYARCLDGPEQLQSWLCKKTHRTQCLTHQRSPHLHGSITMCPDDEKDASTMCVLFVGCHQEGPWRRKHAQYLDGPE